MVKKKGDRREMRCVPSDRSSSRDLYYGELWIVLVAKMNDGLIVAASYSACAASDRGYRREWEYNARYQIRAAICMSMLARELRLSRVSHRG